MLRYLIALNSLGDSTFFAASCAWSETTHTAAAAAAAAGNPSLRTKSMRGSLSSGHDSNLCPGRDAHRTAGAVANRDDGVHLRDGAVSERARVDDRGDEGRSRRGVVRRHAR